MQHYGISEKLEELYSPEHDDRAFKRGYHQAVCYMRDALWAHIDTNLRQSICDYEDHVRVWREDGAVNKTKNTPPGHWDSNGLAVKGGA